jgi:hypothetical protein
MKLILRLCRWLRNHRTSKQGNPGKRVADSVLPFVI